MIIRGSDHMTYAKTQMTLHKPHLVTHIRQDFVDSNITGGGRSAAWSYRCRKPSKPAHVTGATCDECPLAPSSRTMSPLITIRSRPHPERRFVRIYVRFLRESHSILKALEKDGWELERQGEDTLVAGHRLVRDEPAARRRLHELGC
jgi:hypothetical protein